MRGHTPSSNKPTSDRWSTLEVELLTPAAGVYVIGAETFPRFTGAERESFVSR